MKKIMEHSRLPQKETFEKDIDTDFVNTEFKDQRFTECYITSVFQGCCFNNVKFSNCNLKTSSFVFCTFKDCTFENNLLESTDFSYSVFLGDSTFDSNYCYNTLCSFDLLKSELMRGTFGFHIYRIYAGWFEIKLASNQVNEIVTASDYLGNDTPKDFLDALISLGKEESKHEYVCFDDEPGAMILRFTKEHDVLTIEGYVTSRDAMDIEKRDNESLSKEEVISCEFKLHGKYNDFVRQVVNSYELLNSKFEKDWGEYPTASIEVLKDILKKL